MMYLLSRAAVWAECATTAIHSCRLRRICAALDCVVDVEDTTINGSVKNIELAADEIPRLGSIGGA